MASTGSVTFCCGVKTAPRRRDALLLARCRPPPRYNPRYGADAFRTSWPVSGFHQSFPYWAADQEEQEELSSKAGREPRQEGRRKDGREGGSKEGRKAGRRAGRTEGGEKHRDRQKAKERQRHRHGAEKEGNKKKGRMRQREGGREGGREAGRRKGRRKEGAQGIQDSEGSSSTQV